MNIFTGNMIIYIRFYSFHSEDACLKIGRKIYMCIQIDLFLKIVHLQPLEKEEKK